MSPRLPRGRRLLPILILLAFTGILVSYVVYTWQMAEELRRDAAAFSRIYFRVLRATTSEEGLTPEGEWALLQELNGLGIPMVQTDPDGTPTLTLNLPFEADLANPADRDRVRAYARSLDAANPPLVHSDASFVFHYGEPLFLRRLKWIPWLQAALLLGILATAAWMVRASHESERDRIWSAMARESAHQMGTPLSSLVGWLELLGAPEDDQGNGGDGSSEDVDLLGEMRADVGRLEKVSRRFELIGHPPMLEPVDVTDIVRRLARYFRARLPQLGGRVQLVLDLPPGAPAVIGNATLLEWAFENLLKNALDSLGGGEGTIRVAFDGVHADRARYRVEDDGPGVPDALRDSLFEIGVSSKKGGWGVGLSLARRIVVEMHGGALRLEDSGPGATFTVELPVVGDDA